MKKSTCTLYGGHSTPYENVHVGLPQGNEKEINCQFLNRRANSRKIKQNSN